MPVYGILYQKFAVWKKVLEVHGYHWAAIQQDGQINK